MAFLDALRRRWPYATPGFAGGTLEDQIERDATQSPNGQMLTPQNQEAITRPRRVTPPMSPQADQIWDSARRTSTAPVPPELADIAIGEDYDKAHPGRYRINRQGDQVSIRPLDGQMRAFQAGVNPDARGHWPDTFKKLNHPPLPLEMTVPSDASRQRAVSFDPQTGRPNETFHQEKGDTPGLYQAYQRWEPHGAKRGFKNSLKAGLMMAAEGARTTPDDPVTGALAGFGVGLGGATASPNFKNRLLRNWKLRETGGELQNQLGLQKAQAQIDQASMVPITLENGLTVMVPAKQAASIQSRQQEIGLRGDTLEARKKRWDSLSTNERKKLIVSEYKAGLLNNDPRALEQAARELNIPGTLLPAFINGRMRDAIDDEGNLIQVNRQTGEVTPTGEKSFEATKEAGRERRATRAEEGRNLRQARQLAAPPKTGGRAAGPDRAAQRKAAQLIGQIERARGEMELADTKGDATAKNAAQSIGEQAAAELNALDAGYEAGRGEGGYPYYKRRAEAPQAQIGGQYAGRRIKSANIPEFARRHGMTPEEAKAFLIREKAIIY